MGLACLGRVRHRVVGQSGLGMMRCGRHDGARRGKAVEAVQGES